MSGAQTPKEEHGTGQDQAGRDEPGSLDLLTLGASHSLLPPCEPGIPDRARPHSIRKLRLLGGDARASHGDSGWRSSADVERNATAETLVGGIAAGSAQAPWNGGASIPPPAIR